METKTKTFEETKAAYGKNSNTQNKARTAIDTIDTEVSKMAVRHAEELKDFLIKSALVFPIKVSPREFLPANSLDSDSASILIQNYLNILFLFSELSVADAHASARKVHRFGNERLKAVRQLERNFFEGSYFRIIWMENDEPQEVLCFYDIGQAKLVLERLLIRFPERDYIMECRDIEDEKMTSKCTGNALISSEKIQRGIEDEKHENYVDGQPYCHID